MIHYTTTTLANGLKVIVHEDPTLAKAAVNILYHVGSRDETESRTGLAHLFEHLMFSGSENIPDFDTHVQRAGGENNAFTNTDITNYYITLPANQVETAFWLESDRMLGLDFSQKNLDIQKSVVSEEFKQRYLNQPYGDAYLYLRPLMYRVHPYRWMTIGKELSHIETVSLQEIKDFFFSHYAPNNATLVVAGGVRAEKIFRLAEKWFGPIPARELGKLTRPTEPTQQEARSQTVHKDVPFASVFKGYHIPARAAADYHAVELLTDLLTGGKASRLYRYLVHEKRVASQVSAFSWGLYDPGMLSINAQIAEGQTIEAYEEALAEALDALSGVTEAELDRAKNKIESMDRFEKVEIAGRALSLAVCDSIGDANLINTDLANYRAVTLADVAAAQSNYLRADNCSTLYYLPQT